MLIEDAKVMVQHTRGPKPLDPLKRVFVPREWRNLDGTLSLQTTDGQKYTRGKDGVIRSVTKKVNGKQARKARRGISRNARS